MREGDLKSEVLRNRCQPAFTVMESPLILRMSPTNPFAIVTGAKNAGQLQLFQIVQTGNAFGFRPRPAGDRQEQRGENPDNGDHDEEFNSVNARAVPAKKFR